MQYVTGVDEVAADLDGLRSDVEHLDSTMDRIAALTVETMKPFIPRRTGRLRGSARVDSTTGTTAYAAVGGPRATYGVPVNYGAPRRHMRGVDFIGRTNRALEAKATALVDQGIEQAITKRGLS